MIGNKPAVLGSFGIIGLFFLFSAVGIGVPIVCPPNAKTCIKVDFLDPNMNEFSDNCEVVKVANDPTNNGGFGEGWSYDGDYTFTGWGDVAWANWVPADPFDGRKRKVEYNNPDCPMPAPDQNKPKDFPSTAKVAAFIGNPVNVTFNRCCEEPPPPPTSTP